tara:strand:- start:424 stop:606 length:183 start_codon:yes stop_codon:yes gene_type:complete
MLVAMMKMLAEQQFNKRKCQRAKKYFEKFFALFGKYLVYLLTNYTDALGIISFTKRNNSI